MDLHFGSRSNRYRFDDGLAQIEIVHRNTPPHSRYVRLGELRPSTVPICDSFCPDLFENIFCHSYEGCLVIGGEGATEHLVITRIDQEFRGKIYAEFAARNKDELGQHRTPR